MALSDVSLDSSSDSEPTEIAKYKLEVEGWPNLSDQDPVQDEAIEVYANKLLAEKEWLALYEERRMKEQ